MSGIFGIIDLTHRTHLTEWCENTQKRLTHQPWNICDRWVAADAPIGLGRIGIGIFNRDPQPTRSRDGQHLMFMSGELYNQAELRQTLAAAGHDLPLDTSDEALALAAFLAYDTDFASHLDGAFFIAVYDVNKQRLVLANDRFGTYSHYVWRDSQHLVFAPEVKGVVSASFVSRRLDQIAALEYLRFQQLFGYRTFHDGISLYPRATVTEMDVRTGSYRSHTYWDWSHIADRSSVGFEEAVQEVGRLLRCAVERRSEGELRPGVFLSGGLDSRTLLGLMPRRNPPPVSATFGAAGCRDVYYAAQIAHAAGSQHHWFDLPNGNWVLENLDMHFRLTEGFASWIHMHGIHMLPQLRGLMDYNLSGWDGAAVLGQAILVNRFNNQPVNESALVVNLFHRFNQEFTWPGLTDAEMGLLLKPDFQRQTTGMLIDEFCSLFHPYWQARPHYAAEFFYIDQRCMRLTQNMITFGRSHLEERFPYWDYALIDYVYSLRPEVRGPRTLYRELITRETPRLVLIPWEKQEFLPTTEHLRHDLQEWSVRIRRRLGIFPKHATLYADYENYLRHELRPWAESILYDPRTEQHGFFDMDFVRALLERHYAGIEPWTLGKIAPLITFEMVMRAFFD
ncbi:MAG: hypothetical protein JNM70_07025 [Anaerolineae bacterium]|nr:hypothetical protein [Anaerolineae bacterium]